MGYLEIISDANTLIDSFNQAKKGSRWKFSVQNYEMNLLENTSKMQKKIRDGTYEQLPFFEFRLSERGKTRQIKSMHISDRVVQRAVCDYVLVPGLSKYLIYDNGASVKGKGISFARSRLEAQLHRYYRRTGSNDGYILLLDYSKFFDNIPHGQLLERIGEKIKDEEMMRFITGMISSFAVDVSYMTDEEYEFCLGTLYNSLEHDLIPKELLTGEKFMAKSVGIGSQISQVSGVFFPTPIDNYCKTVRGIKEYGRYMDDIEAIHESKAFLQDVLGEVGEISKSLGLFINEKKTQIVKLSHGFTWLKTKYTLTKSGHLIKQMVSSSVTRERRRLKKYSELEKNGEMPYCDIANAYQSWRGNAKHFDSYRSLKNMDELYDSLFVEAFAERQSREAEIERAAYYDRLEYENYLNL